MKQELCWRRRGLHSSSRGTWAATFDRANWLHLDEISVGEWLSFCFSVWNGTYCTWTPTRAKGNSDRDDEVFWCDPGWVGGGGRKRDAAHPAGIQIGKWLPILRRLLWRLDDQRYRSATIWSALRSRLQSVMILVKSALWEIPSKKLKFDNHGQQVLVQVSRVLLATH